MIARAIALFLMLMLSSVQASGPLKEFKQEFSDSVISAKITAKYTENHLLNPLKIGVSTNKGIVTLHGHVGSKEAFVEALRLAVNTQGVRQVDTEELHIKKVNTAFTDALITAKVETAVLKAKVLDDESIPLAGINAHTKDGVVTLTGTLPNSEALSALLKRIYTVRGVRRIISHLNIAES